MPRFVVEPAVALKWFVPEEHSSPAARLLDGGKELIAPDFFYTEASSIATAKVRLEELSPEESIKIIEAINSVPVQIKPTHGLLEPALLVSTSIDIPFRSGMGLTVAVQAECRLVTANRTLYDKVQGTAFARYVKWVGDLR